jgi:hypothetical protein
MIFRMKSLLKFSLLSFAVIAFASCQKTEFDSVSPVAADNLPSYKLVHDGTDADGNMFTDKDKCKKCHTSSRLADIVWNAPYMSDNSYLNLEELIANYDFVNNVHLKKGEPKPKQNDISAEEKDELLSYLKSLEQSALPQSK